MCLYYFTFTAYYTYILQCPFVWTETANCWTSNSISCTVTLAISRLLQFWFSSAFDINQVSAKNYRAFTNQIRKVNYDVLLQSVVYAVWLPFIYQHESKLKQVDRMFSMLTVKHSQIQSRLVQMISKSYNSCQLADVKLAQLDWRCMLFTTLKSWKTYLCMQLCSIKYSNKCIVHSSLYYTKYYVF